MFARLADSFQTIVVAALIAIAAQGWTMSQTMTELSVNYRNLDKTINELKAKVDNQGEVNIKKVDIETYKVQMYERMRSVEESNKVNAAAIAELARAQTQLTRDVSESNIRRNR